MSFFKNGQHKHRRIAFLGSVCNGTLVSRQHTATSMQLDSSLTVQPVQFFHRMSAGKLAWHMQAPLHSRATAAGLQLLPSTAEHNSQVTPLQQHI